MVLCGNLSQVVDESSSATSILEVESLDHNLEPGDHVLRWTNLLLYPIQIHGIVLSAGAGMVTIIDFGLSSSGGKGQPRIEEVDQHVRDRRLNIITLTQQKEVEQWKKVNYGGSILSAGKWAKITSWFRRKEGKQQTPPPLMINEDTTSINGEDSTIGDGKTNHQDQRESQGLDQLTTSSEEPPGAPPPDEIFALQKMETEGILSWLQEQDSEEEGSDRKERLGLEDSDNNDKVGKACCSKNGGSECESNKSNKAPQLPKSDPPSIVLSRVRFLLSAEGGDALPPHHILYANSECIAVWCKTGRFSTLQSQIFLHSTALGNAKTATTVALLVGAQTVTVTSTVPAAGFWGWLGFTTTTTSQVGLLSAQPWLIPVLAGYGIAAVGTPYWILLQAQSKWERATAVLNDAFWQRATPDIYVDAIRHWSGLSS